MPRSSTLALPTSLPTATSPSTSPSTSAFNVTLNGTPIVTINVCLQRHPQRLRQRHSHRRSSQRRSYQRRSVQRWNVQRWNVQRSKRGARRDCLMERLTLELLTYIPFSFFNLLKILLVKLRLAVQSLHICVDISGENS